MTSISNTYLTVVLLLCTVNLFSQINVKVSASNQFRFGTGKENILSGDISKKYFEELGDLRLFINDFQLGARFEYDDPIEFGKGKKGMSRRFIEFRKEAFLTRAGNFYEIFAKGLTLNSFESRPIGFNTEFDGARINYRHTFGKKNKVRVNATVLGGGMDYTDINDTSRTENYSIRAANFGISPVSLFNIGFSYLFANGKIPTGNILTEIDAEIYEANFGFNWKSLDMFISYANKVTILHPNQVYTKSEAPRGDGAYASVSFAGSKFGVNVEYKNYRFNLVTPDKRGATSPFKPLPFQNAPSCIKVYSTTLLSRFPHNVDFGDEVGFQTDVFYSPYDRLTVNLNASLSSRHYDYYDSDTTVLTRYQRIDRKYSFLPSVKNEFSPYWEFFAEAEYQLNKNMKAKLGFARKTSVLYSIVDPSSSDIIRAVTIPAEFQYQFGRIYGIKLTTEFQRAFNSLRSDEKHYNSQYTSLVLSRSPDVIVAGNFEFTDDEEDPSGKKFWANGELTYKFSSSNIITLSYGSERGGLKCSSGICRYVNPFNGFRLTLVNNFN
jgi:hypothetical protein